MFILPDLPYDYDKLQPYIDKETMLTHHTKHHAGYVKNLNEALTKIGSKETSIEKIIRNISKYPIAIRNNGGGHYNHSLFWKILTPHNQGGGKPSKKFLKIIESSFTSFDQFKKEFEKAASTRFGSGWAWLCIDVQSEKLFICSTANQDNPLMDIEENKGKQGIPILALDVWEHAYYLLYKNKRPDYISAFWKVVNWKEVERLYDAHHLK